MARRYFCFKRQGMKKYVITVITAIAVFIQVGFAQHTIGKITIGNIDTIHSGILNEKRTVWVYVPDGDNTQRYPVLYLLDAESHFHSAVGIIRQLCGVLPDMIIVGITNTNRERDLTPTAVQPGNIVNEGDAKTSGGGEAFLQFVQQELMPYIDKTYPTTSYKVFSGHSLGGLSVVNAFIHHPNLFNAYIALDPSLWWDNQKLLKQAQAMLPAAKFDNKTLFVGIANNMPPGMDSVAVQQDTLNSNTLVTRSTLLFVHALNNIGNNGLRFGYKYFPTERHGTVELLGEYDALHFVFDYYHFNTKVFDANPDLNIDSLVIAHYDTISNRLGYKVLPTEDLINNLGYTCMGLHKNDKAYTFFKMNIDNHPNSSNAYDSLGDYYVEVGDTKKAIESFTKSLSLQETADTRRKLEEQKKKK